MIIPLSTPTAWLKPKSNKKDKNEFLTLGQLWFTLKSIEKEEKLKHPDIDDPITRNGITYKDVSLEQDLIDEYAIVSEASDKDYKDKLLKYFRKGENSEDN